MVCEIITVINAIIKTYYLLSASNVMSRGNLKMETMTFDRPFIFYVRDVIDNVVLAAGKIMEIPAQEEIAVNFN